MLLIDINNFAHWKERSTEYPKMTRELIERLTSLFEFRAEVSQQWKVFYIFKSTVVFQDGFKA